MYSLNVAHFLKNVVSAVVFRFTVALKCFIISQKLRSQYFHKQFSIPTSIITIYYLGLCKVDIYYVSLSLAQDYKYVKSPEN